MNRIIILLIISDILIISGFGFVTPIFAIFLKDEIIGGSIVAAGTAMTIFLLTKSILQIPISIYTDKKRSKLTLLYLGTILIALTPFIYAMANNIKWIYFAQLVFGLGVATAYPSWFSLFTMHLDKKHRGLEWSIWGTGVGLGTALTAYFGAKIVQSYGFNVLFVITGIFAFLGFLILLILSKKYLKKVDNISPFFFPRFSDHHMKSKIK